MSFIDKWKDKITEYVDVRVQLIKLSFVERTSHILGYFVYVFIVLSLLLPILIFLGMGLSEAFTELFDSRTAGYFMTLGVYVLLTLIVMLCRKQLINKAAGIFIAKLTDDDDDNDEEQQKTTV
ncbi:MAG: hypothetical protein BGO69_08575 [Bacteroidetes bacterium 46-16]|nr:MAG: hypothetical protein BGO69_08575 [Bacteroidetes bacterium 46-16]